MKTAIICLLLLLSIPCYCQETVTMKEYLDAKTQQDKEWMIKYLDAQFKNIEDNINKANSAMEKRLDGMNEIRGQLKDQAGTFITRNELWASMFGIVTLVIATMTYLQSRKKPNGIIK